MYQTRISIGCDKGNPAHTSELLHNYYSGLTEHDAIEAARKDGWQFSWTFMCGSNKAENAVVACKLCSLTSPKACTACKGVGTFKTVEVRGSMVELDVVCKKCLGTGKEK